MKKCLLSLLVLFSLHAVAMVEETVSFNFKEPLNLNLNPSLTTADINLLNDGEGGGVLVRITDKTVTNGPVVLSFSRPDGTPGAGIARYGNGAPFCLEMGRLLSMTFSLSGGCILSSVNFDNDSDITKPEGQPGSWNYITNTWTATDNSTTSVTLRNGDQSAKIYTITVKYLRPSAPMNFISSIPAQGATVEGTFKTLTMSFSSSVVQVNNALNIKLTGSDLDGTVVSQVMAETHSGNIVTLTAGNAITKDADLKVTVPAGTFQNSEGAVNIEDIVVSFKVQAKRNDFNPTSVEPQSGTWSELPKEIRLTFNNFVKPGVGSIKFTQTDGTLSFSVSTANVVVNNNVATIIHNYTITEPGSWTVDIPEKAFHNDFTEDDPDYRWNSTFTINYTIDGSAAGPQDSQTMKDAKALLQKNGVGYPTHNNPAWIALNNLVNSEDVADDESLQAAILDLYNTTEVQMPEADKWYTITGVNSEKKNICLTFNDDKTKVILGTNLDKAAAFKVKSVSNDKVVFQTKEGLFLHIPTVLPQHEGTTDANLTAEESVVNELSLAKFSANSVSGANPKDLFGTFTIYGSLGKVTGLDVDDFAYAMLDYENIKVATYPNIPLAFAAKMSSAFLFSETTEPVDVIDLIYPTVGFIPDVIDNAGDDMKVKINGPTSTAIADNSLIYFAKHTEGGGVGEKVPFEGIILTSIPDEANTFAVNTRGLASGMYFLIMDNGAFTFTAPAGKGIRPINLIGGPITIKDGSGEVIPTANLNKSELKAGENLILTIGNVGKAILKTPSAPYYEYMSGEHVGESVYFTGNILTSKVGTTANFDVNTEGLVPGSYKLVLPSETFVFEATKQNQTVKNNVQLVCYFDILSQGGSTTDEGFVYNFTSFIEFFPASLVRNGGYYRDTDLNQMIIYVYSTIANGLVANKEKRVDVVTTNGGVATSGHFETYTTFAQDYPDYYIEYLRYLTGVYALKFVPTPAIEAGTLDNWSGYYYYHCPAGTFGDSNYGKWLANNSSIDPSQCRVNPVLNIGNVLVNNRQATDGIKNIYTDAVRQTVYDLQGRRVEKMDKRGVYIVNGKKVINTK